METFERLPLVKEINYTTACLLDYNHFKNYYKMIAINLIKFKTTSTRC